jgi:DNA polymerase-3 subunit delta'
VARAPKIEEERPPHDALEGVALPRETPVLVGHADAEHALLSAYRSGRMHHAWIISGERGIGRATLAFRLARFLLAYPDPQAEHVASAGALYVPPEHPAARRVAAMSHPNLLHLQRDWDDRRKRYRTELSVDMVRKAIPFLGMTAGEGPWRVIIVDTADDMSPSAANAILKMLEEPPSGALFLLLARSRGALLPTIVSRCRPLDLAPLSAAETEAVVRAVAPDAAADGDEATSGLAAGSPRRLIELRRGDGLNLYKLMLRAIELGHVDAQLQLSALASDAAGMEQFLFLYAGYLGRRVRAEREPLAAANPPLAPLVTWAELWENAVRSGREVETYNLDRRQFVLDLLEKSAAALRRSGNQERT